MTALRAGALVATCLALGSLAPHAAAQDVVVREAEEPPRDLGWSNWISDVPAADLTGLWQFLPATSDPMVDAWVGRRVAYEISQQTTRIVMTFRPENGEPNIQEYRWDGSVNAFRRGTAEVRERARWTDNGRTLEVEGRWWMQDDVDTVASYSFVYTLEANRQLVFKQVDEYGETTWRFSR